MNLFDQISTLISPLAVVMWDAAGIDLPDAGPGGRPCSPTSPVLVCDRYVFCQSYLCAVWRSDRRIWLPRRVAYPFPCQPDNWRYCRGRFHSLSDMCRHGMCWDCDRPSSGIAHQPLVVTGEGT